MTLKTQFVLATMVSMMVTGGGAAAIAETQKAPQTVEGAEALTPDESIDTFIDEINITPVDAEATDLEAIEGSVGETFEEVIETEVELDEVPLDSESEATETVDPQTAESEAVEPEAMESETMESDAMEADAQKLEATEPEATDSETSVEADSPLVEPVIEEEESVLDALQSSAALSLKDALSIIDSEMATAGSEARSVTFMGAVDQPIIAVEVGMKAIAIDATAGDVLAVKELREIPDSEILKAAETATLLKRYAKVTLKEALQAAENFAGAEAQQVALSLDEGSLVYRAKVAEQEIVVDAGDAQVLYTSSDNLEVDGKPNGSIQLMELEKAPQE